MSNFRSGLALGIGLLSATAFSLPAPALADVAKARACADRLNPPARMMYDHVAPKVKSSSNIRDLMRAEVPSLVISGKLSRDLAQKNALSAGQCLVLLK